jgi:protein SCO1/2
MRIKYGLTAVTIACTLIFFSFDHCADAADSGIHSLFQEKKSGDAGDIKLLDLELLNQNGKKVRFVSDVLQDKIVVMNFVFTSCPTACPILIQIFVLLQEELGDRLGTEVALVSISVDPTRDIPPRLKKYALEKSARAEWAFLTGKKRNVDQVLTGLDSYSVDIWEHATKVMVGDMQTGKWVNLFGFPGPDEILEKIDELKIDREKYGMNSDEN